MIWTCGETKQKFWKTKRKNYFIFRKTTTTTNSNKLKRNEWNAIDPILVHVFFVLIIFALMSLSNKWNICRFERCAEDGLNEITLLSIIYSSWKIHICLFSVSFSFILISFIFSFLFASFYLYFGFFLLNLLCANFRHQLTFKGALEIFKGEKRKGKKVNEVFACTYMYAFVWFLFKNLSFSSFIRLLHFNFSTHELSFNLFLADDNFLCSHAERENNKIMLNEKKRSKKVCFCVK